MTALGTCFRCGCEIVAVAVRETMTGLYYCADCAEKLGATAPGDGVE